MTLRWGLLSTARINDAFIAGVAGSDRCEVLAVASRDGATARAYATARAIPRAHEGYDALLADPDVDAVYISLPNALHLPWTQAALRAGKHVLCEKPIALNAQEARTMIDARNASGRQVIEAFMVRHHPQWQRMREWVRAGRIGNVGAIQSAFLFTMLDPNNVRNKPELGGGALYDVGCYPLVTARYLFEAEPERVIALCDRDPVMGIDRLTSGLVAFPGGRQLVFSSAMQLANYQRVTVLGSAGRIEAALPFTPPKDHVCELKIDTGKSLDGSSAQVETVAAADQYALQCDRASAIFRGEETPEFPLEDALANIRVIDALYRSVQSGRWETP